MNLKLPDDETLFIRTIGQGQTVLVLSGLGMRSWQWLPFLLPFARRYRFIIPDWRGFGGSKHCQIGLQDAIHSHWSDLACLIQQLELTNIKVIAYSMGATTAMYGMQYANFAKKINAYLHIEQSPCIRNQIDWQYGLYAEQQPDFLKLLHHLSHSLNGYCDFKTMPEAQQQRLLHAWQALIEFQGTQPWLLQGLEGITKFQTLAQYVIPLQNLNMMQWYVDTYRQHDLDLRASLATLNCPITWLSGAHSSLYPLKGQQVLAKQLGAQHIIFPKSGHAPLLSEPQRFYQSLRDFLA